MAGFGIGVSSSAKNSSNHKKAPPPLASSTPKKRTNGLLNGFSPSNLKSKANGVNMIYGRDGSPLKKQKTVYMDEDEEDAGESLSHTGRATPIGGRDLSKTGQAKALKKFEELQEQRRQLPIAKGREALICEFQENDTVVLIGETGSGKTTQVPQYILEAGICGNGQIAVTQPRRVAATSLAARVAEEQGVALGTYVGYAVRFNEKHEARTKIKYLTDGMLSRELLADPLLSRYSVVIIDEAHERTLNTDVLLANLKTIQKERKASSISGKSTNNAKGKGKVQDEKGPLKIIVMSATLDAEKFSHFFHRAKILYVKGRQHPVKIYHSVNSQPDYADAAVRTFFQIHLESAPGDVLIFLPGQEDIEAVQGMIKTYTSQLPVDQMGVLTCPMYAQLQQSQQTLVFRPAPQGARKCILATNIAETSITIPGVRYVIDSGKHNEKRHYEYTGGGLDSLMTQDISKSSAMQRAGRAGREGPGFCFRLYTESNFHQMADAYLPEILRTNLVASALQLKCLGQDIQELEFMDPPDDDTVKAAYAALVMLGALDRRKEITPIGRTMNRFPLDPSHSRALMAARELGCILEVLGIVSVLSASAKLFFDSSEHREAALDARARFRHASGDHLTALNALRAYEELVSGGASKGARRQWCNEHYVNERTLAEAMDIQSQLRGICERLKMDWRASAGDNVVPVLEALLSGLAQNTAVYRPETKAYKQILSKSMMKIKIHPGSVLSDRRPVAIMYDQPLYTKEIYARGVSIVEPSMISRHPSFQLSKA